MRKDSYSSSAKGLPDYIYYLICVNYKHNPQDNSRLHLRLSSEANMEERRVLIVVGKI